MNEEQRKDIFELFGKYEGTGVLDYVTGWYLKTAKYIQGTKSKAAFVSTNSIVQGEQVYVLWNLMIKEYKTTIHFAHRTFKWSNEAKGNAAVYCVIIGFASYDIPEKRLFEYDDIKGEPHEIKSKNINAYLVDGKNLLIDKNNKPISPVNSLIRGSIPYDDGNLLLSTEEYEDVITKTPELKKFIRIYGGASELINNKWRYCIWLKDASPTEIRNDVFLTDRINKVKEFRINSKGQSVKSKASTPSLFGDIRQPIGENYLLIPRHSSERRTYIPIGYVNQSVILADSAYGLPNASLFHFGILTSTMHMAWVKTVCGRLKSDFRYSKDIVYNNFPWPENPTEKQKQTVEQAAQQVLDARAQFPNSSLADLYDPLTMPPALVKAHQQLDKAVDQCYRSAPFTSEAKRMEFLFELYEKYTAGLLAGEKKKGRKK